MLHLFSNLQGKLWSSIFNANCGQSVCKKSGKKGEWQECPKAATEENIEELKENIEELKDFLLEMKKELEVKIEQTCGKKYINRYFVNIFFQYTSPLKQPQKQQQHHHLVSFEIIWAFTQHHMQYPKWLPRGCV